MSSERPGERPPAVGTAVVIGASMAGLCAARVLSDRCEQVIVVDRDRLPAAAEWRSQVPQGRHPHLLLPAGARLLEAWFPGLEDELHAAGATHLDLSGDFYWHQCGGVLRRPRSTVGGPAMSRPLLEWAVRRRVADLPNVDLRAECVAEGFVADSDAARITGVRLADATTIDCELVVDATGRHARSLVWLEQLGYEPPPVSTVEVDTRYVTRVFHRDGRPEGDWVAAAVVGDPESRRLAMALPAEGDRWLVLLGGLNGEVPPSDDAAALAYAREFDSPVIADLMAASEQLGAAVTHRFLANQRRHVERLRRFPLGWVPLGDAVCSFDPIYGQGMASAAMQASALGAALDREGAVNRPFARRYLKAAARVVATPWSIAVGGDFAYPGTKGKKPPGTDLFNSYFERVTIAAQHDDHIANRYNEVIALVRRPESLLAPAFVIRVLWTARRGPARTV